MQKKLRNGLTTGTCATAALKAALLLIYDGQLPKEVEVKNPQGQMLRMGVAGGGMIARNHASAWTVKDAGDDIDVTHGCVINVEVEVKAAQGIEYVAGDGVGVATKAGLFIPVGEPAINPGPRKMMQYVLDEFLPEGKGAVITISVSGGEELAKQTLNPMLGIEGGISIIGTTGIVRPMSEEAFKDSLVPQLAVIKESQFKVPVLVPGKIGENIALRYGFDAQQLVQTSNFIGFMLDQAVAYEFADIVVFGHIGKLIKLAGGIFHTHSHVADARQEIFAAYLAMEGASQNLIEHVLKENTTEAIMQLVQQENLQSVYPLLVKRAAARCCQHVKNKARIGVVFVDMAGNILAADDNAKAIGASNNWNIR